MTGKIDESERRAVPRILKAVPIEVARLQYPLTPGRGNAGVLRDISQQGVCCIVPARYEPGVLLSLRLKIKGWHRYKRGVSSILNERLDKEPLTAIGEVVWCGRRAGIDGFAVGVRFTDVYEDDQAALQRYLDAVLKHGNSPRSAGQNH